MVRVVPLLFVVWSGLAEFLRLCGAGRHCILHSKLLLKLEGCRHEDYTCCMTTQPCDQLN